MTTAAIFCFIIAAFDLIMTCIRANQGRSTCYLYAISAALFALLGLNEMGVL